MAARSTSTFTSILLIVLGILAVLLPWIAGIAIAVIVGWVFLVGGIAYLAHSFSHGSTGHKLWHIVVGLAFAVAGLYFIVHPAAGLITLTLFVAWLFFFEAIVELVRYFSMRATPGSGWILFNALVTLVLAVMIWRHWPASSAWALGTLLGVDLMISGFTRLMYGNAARRTLLPV